jgi:hypothetical protein
MTIRRLLTRGILICCLSGIGLLAVISSESQLIRGLQVAGLGAIGCLLTLIWKKRISTREAWMGGLSVLGLTAFLGLVYALRRLTPLGALLNSLPPSVVEPIQYTLVSLLVSTGLLLLALRLSSHRRHRPG